MMYHYHFVITNLEKNSNLRLLKMLSSFVVAANRKEL